jgi:heat shock protein HtpX
VQLLGSGAPLADALEDIARDRTALQVNPVSAPMYIVNPLSGARASSLFSTHPPVRERVRRPRTYDQAMRPNVAVLRPDRAARWAA